MTTFVGRFHRYDGPSLHYRPPGGHLAGEGSGSLPQLSYRPPNPLDLTVQEPRVTWVKQGRAEAAGLPGSACVITL
jgi:hypothetical protein